jgi:hypothetical protein
MSESNGIDSVANVRETQVLLLADTPASENQEVVQAAAAVISAARDASLVAVICTHVESKQPATILCSMYEDKDNPGTAQYAPLAMLFTPGNAPWAAYEPPLSATTLPNLEDLDPLDMVEFSEETDDESESEETT